MHKGKWNRSQQDVADEIGNNRSIRSVDSRHKEPFMQNYDTICCYPEKEVEQTDRLLVIWDTMALIRRHC